LSEEGKVDYVKNLQFKPKISIEGLNIKYIMTFEVFEVTAILRNKSKKIQKTCLFKDY